MEFELNGQEIRVLGCLLEKAITTPDQYPLTLNSLTNACNQKSSRDPVMTLNPGEVQRTCRGLKEQHLVSIDEGQKLNTEKYTQRLCNTLLSELQFDASEYAIVCLLLLRGPQTPGELRSRGGRLYQFDDNQEVTDCLNSLMERSSGALVARLSKQSGRQDHQYMHLFSGNIASVEEAVDSVQKTPVSGRENKLQELEKRVVALESALIALGKQLGEDVDLGQLGCGNEDPSPE